MKKIITTTVFFVCTFYTMLILNTGANEKENNQKLSQIKPAEISLNDYRFGSNNLVKDLFVEFPIKLGNNLQFKIWDLMNFSFGWGFESDEERYEREQAVHRKRLWIYSLSSAVFLFLFVWYQRKYPKGFKIIQENPIVLNKLKNHYSINYLKGTVTQWYNSQETHTSVTVHQNTVSSYTSTTEHERFMFLGENGREYSIDLIDTGIRLRPGNIISAFWVVEKRKSTGTYICFYNHDTDRITFLYSDIYELHAFDIIPSVLFLFTFFTFFGLTFELFFEEHFFTQIFLSLLGFGIYTLVDFMATKRKIADFADTELKKIVVNILKEKRDSANK